MWFFSRLFLEHLVNHLSFLVNTCAHMFVEKCLVYLPKSKHIKNWNPWPQGGLGLGHWWGRYRGGIETLLREMGNL